MRFGFGCKSKPANELGNERPFHATTKMDGLTAFFLGVQFPGGPEKASSLFLNDLARFLPCG